MDARADFLAAVKRAAEQLARSTRTERDDALDAADIAMLDALLIYVRTWSWNSRPAHEGRPLWYTLPFYKGRMLNLLDGRIDAECHFVIDERGQLARVDPRGNIVVDAAEVLRDVQLPEALLEDFARQLKATTPEQLEARDTVATAALTIREARGPAPNTSAGADYDVAKKGLHND